MLPCDVISIRSTCSTAYDRASVQLARDALEEEIYLRISIAADANF